MKTLKDFIKELGDEKSGKLFEVKTRTALSWRLGQREPRPDQARLIVKKTARHRIGPVTMDGIYGLVNFTKR